MVRKRATKTVDRILADRRLRQKRKGTWGYLPGKSEQGKMVDPRGVPYPPRKRGHLLTPGTRRTGSHNPALERAVRNLGVKSRSFGKGTKV